MEPLPGTVRFSYKKCYGFFNLFVGAPICNAIVRKAVSLTYKHKISPQGGLRGGRLRCEYCTNKEIKL